MKARPRTSMVPFSLALLMSVSGIAMAQQETARQKEKQTAQQSKEVNRQAMEWLRDIQTNTVQIADHAAKLKTMLRHPGTYPRASHEFELLSIRDRINDIGELVPRLQNRTDAPGWQQEIIDEVASLLAAMATQTENAIELVREDPADPTIAPTADLELSSNAYEARIVGIQHYAEHIDELVDYADTRTERRRQQEQTTQSMTSGTSSR